MITILLVDDHAMVRAGLRRVLGEQPDMQLVGEAASGEEAVTLVRRLVPQVVLMDLHMPGMSGLEATERIVRGSPKVRVIIVTMQEEDPFPRRLLQVGACGYLTKAGPEEELVKAVREVSLGRRYIAPAIAQRLALASLPGQNPANPFDRLTPRELEIALGLARGESMVAIGRRLNISAKTVATHKYRIYEKLDVHSEVELAHLALQYGLITAGMRKKRP